MSYKVIQSKAEGNIGDPVVLDSGVQTIESGLGYVDATDVLWYEVQRWRKSGAEVIELHERAIVVDGSDRAKYVIDIIEEA